MIFKVMKATPSPLRCINLLITACWIVMLFTPQALALPEYTGNMVNDWAWVLSYDEDEYLENLCRSIEEETTVEIYIVTTTDLEGYDINRYSYLLFNEWGIGQEDLNNGLLLTLYYVDINETHFAYEFRIEVGRGLEGAITDSEAGRIARDNFTYWFNWYEFYWGFEEGILELYSEIMDGLTSITITTTHTQQNPLVAFQTWGYENSLFAGIFVGIGFMVLSFWLQMEMMRQRMVIIPIIAIIGLFIFAWWWDPTGWILIYGIAIAIGARISLAGVGRVRSGGGRTEGGGFTY
jgi:uncharacterized membrane protein YgcG